MRDIYLRNPDSSGCSAPTRRTATGWAPSSTCPTGAGASGSRTSDVKLSRDGRVMEVLSRAQLPRLARGLHPDRAARAVRDVRGVRDGQRLEDDPAQQVARRRPTHLPGGAKVPSLNILLTSTAWRNDHNGFSHQGPGLIQNVINQRGEVVRVYLPPDANCLLSVADHCFRSSTTST